MTYDELTITIDTFLIQLDNDFKTANEILESDADDAYKLGGCMAILQAIAKQYDWFTERYVGENE